MTTLVFILIIGSVIFLFPYVLLLITFLLSRKRVIFKIINKVDVLPSISIVIATYNEEKNIDKKIENILNLDYPKNKMEIIVVDSSNDKTPDKVLEWTDSFPNLTLIRELERKGLATALNLGYATAKGEIVIKSDCDITHPVNALQQIVNPFYDSSVGAVTGKQILINSPSASIRSEKGYRSLKDFICEIHSRLDSTHIFEPFSAYKKELIEPISVNSVADDGELALLIRKKGYKTIFQREAHFFETAPVTMIDKLRQKSRRGQGHVQLLLQNLDILFNRKYGYFGLVIFPTIFFLMIINPWLLLGLGMGAIYLISDIVVINYVLLLIAASTFLVLLYGFGYPMFISGFIESQISLIIGTVSLIISGPSYMWEKKN